MGAKTFSFPALVQLIVALFCLSGFQSFGEENVSLGDIRKAADQGDASAQYHLGFCYINGTGVVKNEVESVKWYRKAAEQGYAGS